MNAASHRTPEIAARCQAAGVASIDNKLTLPLALGGLALASLLTASALSLIPDAHAATGIQRCIAADGTPIYTDKPCTVLDAQRAPISGELLSRIARDEAAHAADGLLVGDVDGSPRATPQVARRSAASGCARTPTQLTMDLQGAWALGDVNRIAESYHWVGLSHRNGQQIMQQLDRLATHSLLQAEYFDAQIGSGSMQLADASSADASGASGAAGVLQVMFADGGSRTVQDFEVERYRGCYFIRF